MPDAPKKITIRKHNWVALKKEFLTGDYHDVAEFLKKKQISVSNAIRTKGWADEKKTLDKKALEKVTEHAIDTEFTDIMKNRMRQARLARYLQIKGAKKIESIKSEDLSVDDARKLIALGFDTERKALGWDSDTINQNNLQINISPQTNLDKIIQDASYEEILEIVASIRRERTRRVGSHSSTRGAEQVSDGEVV